MKKAVILLLSLIITLCSCSNEDIDPSVVSDFPQSEADVNFSENETSVDNSEEIINTEGENFMKAVWISQFDMSSILKENGNQREKESFKGLYRTVLNNIKNDGYNAVIVQVRPYADSFYPSKYFPTSNYVNGDFYSELRYDPFEVIVSLAKEIGLSVHAWLNPMRAMKSKEIINVPDRYIIKEWYNDPERNGKYIVEVDGRYYLNPAYEEVRALIANGAKEVLDT